MSRLGFVGLGRMGFPLAGHLSSAGHEVRVFDVIDAQTDRWLQEHDGRSADGPRQAAEGAEAIVTSLPADSHLREVAFGDDGVLAGLGQGSVWVDHSTASAEVSRELAAAAVESGAGFLDGPVSGGVQGAQNGTLTVMIGGADADFARAAPIVETYASLVTHMGPSGAGQLTKMANQICVVGLCQALAEGLDFAESAGLDTAKVVSVMLKGSSTSWQMENRSQVMLDAEYEFGFSTQLMRKDIGLCLDEARRLSISLPVTAMVDRFLADVEKMGGSHWDWCSLMEHQRTQRT